MNIFPVYPYIVNSNPDEVNNLCIQNGYPNAASLDELTYNVVSMVADKGELAFKKIMELHPDKDVILKIFKPDNNSGGNGITEVTRPPMMLQAPAQPVFANATGSQTNSAVSTNEYILLAAIIVSTAIIWSIKD